MSSAIDLLLGAAIPEPETKEIKIKRLSKICGADVIFTIRELGFNRVADLKKMHDDGELSLHIVLAGVASPDLKNQSLMEKYGVLTPADLLKKMLTPGEIEDISREIEKLSGYRVPTIEEIKKK